MRVAPSGLQWMPDAFHGKLLLSRGALRRAKSVMRDRDRIARGKIRIPSNAKPLRSEETAGVGPAFQSSVMSISPDQAFKKQINEGSGTPANAGSSTAASCDAARALLERARLPAFHHGSHLRELFHPKG
jgi:hypothetical protein